MDCMDRFKSALESCGLGDLGFVGDTFTWRNNNHTAANYIRERLDRAVATQAWCNRFTAYRVTNGDPRHSDHRPVIIDTDGAATIRRCLNNNLSPRFEAGWLEEEGCRDIVKSCWEKETQEEGKNVSGAVKGVLKELVDWNKNILGDLEKRIHRVKKELEAVRRKSVGQEQVNREHILRFKLSRLEEQLETYWKQRAHVNWMKGGDRNTKFFHAAATERRKRNRIRRLRKEDGSVVDKVEEMKEVATNYFRNLFTSRAGDLKAPGPDGMPSVFYKKCWDVVGDNIVAEVLNVLNGGPMPEGWNGTCVVLIPKVKSPESMKDLRPISLCNVVYKTVSKNKREGKEGYAAVKLDMSKAYDRVEWHFLEKMMRKMGFSEVLVGKNSVMHWLSWELLTRPKKDGGMGFRDIYGFNMAMLARQAWRMLTTPEYLCARVLKARYFPRTSILEAQAHPGISYTWRSILKGVALMKEGLICRVGDGTTIKIWSDPWLNKQGVRTPMTPRGGCLLTRVCELVDPDTQQWDERLVRDIFSPDEAKIILATPVREEYEDFYAWFDDSKGQFSVKSAYKLYVKERDAGLPGSSTLQTAGWEWKEIWTLPCQPKIQHFFWRLAHNSLPLKLNIKRRGIECDTVCVCCKRLDEDGAHLFPKCKLVKKIWRTLQLEDVRERLCTCTDASAVVQEILRLPENKKLLAICLLWRWWTWRNKVNAGETAVHLNSLPAEISHWATDSLAPPSTEQRLQPVQEWKKPREGSLKLNCDGAYSEVLGTGGWGFAVRDHNGDVRGSGAGSLRNVASAIQAEAEACAAGLEAAANWGMTNLQVELDSQVLVKALQVRASAARTRLTAAAARYLSLLECACSVVFPMKSSGDESGTAVMPSLVNVAMDGSIDSLVALFLQQLTITAAPDIARQVLDRMPTFEINQMGEID
ncbi:uncharacterized protein [Aegilops tauschii subsp. strangulata]|uniref:uncharacterized protein n=1 Tax=Aegilops tauschii subsp. strangulata TaxID=200361 RepID=UPI003CC8C419